MTPNLVGANYTPIVNKKTVGPGILEITMMNVNDDKHFAPAHWVLNT